MAIVANAAVGRSSGKPKTEETPADLPQVSPEDKTPDLPATRDSGALANTSDSPAPRKLEFDPESGVSGDWDETDILLPTLRLARGSGESTADFTEGSLLLGDEVVLDPPNLKNPSPDAVLSFIPYGMKKRWREEISKEERDAGMRARIVDSREEVAELGGSTYKDDGLRQWKRCADLYLLVEAPKDCTVPDFALDLDGKQYASVIYYARGTDFWGMAKDIFQCLNTVLNAPAVDPKTGEAKLDENGRPVRKAQLYKHVWTMRVIKRMSGDFMVYTPKVTLTKEKPGPEALAHIQNLIGA